MEGVSITPQDDARFATKEALRHIMLDYMQMTEFVKEPFILARADGIRFWDVHGKEYLDGLAGVYVVNVAYNNPRMLEAVRRQLETLPFNPPMHGTNRRAVELATLLAEVALSSLGLGEPPPQPTWGNILQDSEKYIREAPWIAIFPGRAIALSVLGLNLFGDAVRDVMDPRLRT